MAYSVLYKDIIFVEGEIPYTHSLGLIDIHLGFEFGAQLKNLNDVKERMRIEAKQLGANCIVDFKYGQKAKLLALDDVQFYGNGIAVRLPEVDYQARIEKIKNR